MQAVGESLGSAGQVYGHQEENSLVENINRKKKSGTSRTKKDSTVDPKAYEDMQKGWPKSAAKKTAAKKKAAAKKKKA